MSQPQPERSRTFAHPPAYFEDALEDAERLLKHASEIGITVDDNVRNHILEARIASGTEWDEDTAANLLASLGKRAAQLMPVTAASLKACSGRTAPPKYWKISICLAVLIVLVSALSYITSAVSGTIKADIASANDLAVKLRGQLGPAPPAIRSGITFGDDKIADAALATELQEYAGDIREIDSEARQLRMLVPGPRTDPFPQIRGNVSATHDMFQFPPGTTDLAGAASKLTLVYQDARYYGQSLVENTAVFYGAITACILPVLYALLGTCAYLLRTFEQQISARTYTPSVANSPRFLTAAIGGAVVGLFNNVTMGQDFSVPPLAIAFLVGYAVDVFFAFLDAMSQKFIKPQTAGGGKA